MGRHPKPLEVHLANNTYKPHLHGPLDPSRFVQLEKLPDECPDDLNAWARDVWHRLYKPLTEAGVLTVGERELFVNYCMAAGVAEQARDEIRKNGIVKVKAKKHRAKLASFATDEKAGEESQQVTRWWGIWQDATALVSKLAGQLGLTAIDRAKIVRQKPGEKAVPNSRPKTALDALGKLNVS